MLTLATDKHFLEYHDELMDLMEYASGNKDENGLRTLLGRYQTDDRLALYVYLEDEQLIGLLGSEVSNGTGIIRHLAVKPHFRQMGYGRRMIEDWADWEGLQMIVAETDDEAVDFYRRCGFQVSSLGEKYPGVERFRCEKHLADDE